MIINISYTKEAKKFFIKHEDVKEKFKVNLKKYYQEKQTNIDIKKLQTKMELYRMRIGKYRVIYTFDEKNNEILFIGVLGANSRGDIYKKIVKN